MNIERNFVDKIVTIERHILEQQSHFPEATGTLTNLLNDLALSAKIIASHTTRAGLAEILGSEGKENVHGDDVQKLDTFAERTIYRMNDHTGRLAVMASEEEEEIIPIPNNYPTGKYVLLYDPLDGSSNIDFNVSVGTIFGIHRRKTAEGPGTLEDCLQPGRDLVASGYIIYGTSTMLVYTTGAGVHGFTLDPSIGEFFLSNENIRIPEKAAYLSYNESNASEFAPELQNYLADVKNPNAEKRNPLNARYIGSLVAVFHRNLLKGGLFMYPGTVAKPKGKLRLLYEANPMAFIAEQAGGMATNGRSRILDIEPTELHQRTPLFIGSKGEMETLHSFLNKN